MGYNIQQKRFGKSEFTSIQQNINIHDEKYSTWIENIKNDKFITIIKIVSGSIIEGLELIQFLSAWLIEIKKLRWQDSINEELYNTIFDYTIVILYE